MCNADVAVIIANKPTAIVRYGIVLKDYLGAIQMADCAQDHFYIFIALLL
ncbi:MAG: hypothetical protein Q4B40_03070 [Clostridia bacterium]|nr:hypothetical protein [Clostridia bacterium]